MPWPEVVGHAPVAAHLERAAGEGVLPHAVMLTGPEGVGKTTLALALAADLLQATAWPGGLAAHPDHWREDSDTENIGIARIRAGGGTPETGPSLQDALALKAYAGGPRVAVIGRAERLTEPAADCLLKTLEEPPDGAHIVLTSARPEKLPATILSRCQVFGCAPVPAAEVRAWLSVRHGVEDRLAALAARLSGGRPGRALALATRPGALLAEVDALDAFLAIAGGGRRQALRAAAELAPPSTAEGRERAVTQVTAWSGFVRDVAALRAGADDLIVWDTYRAAAERWAESLPLDRLTFMLGRCAQTADQLAAYAVPRLCYEVLFLDVFVESPAPPRTEPPLRDPALAGLAAATPPTPRPRSPRRRS